MSTERSDGVVVIVAVSAIILCFVCYSSILGGYQEREAGARVEIVDRALMLEEHKFMESSGMGPHLDSFALPEDIVLEVADVGLDGPNLRLQIHLDKKLGPTLFVADFEEKFRIEAGGQSYKPIQSPQNRGDLGMAEDIGRYGFYLQFPKSAFPAGEEVRVLFSYSNPRSGIVDTISTITTR